MAALRNNQATATDAALAAIQDAAELLGATPQQPDPQEEPRTAAVQKLEPQRIDATALLATPAPAPSEDPSRAQPPRLNRLKRRLRPPVGGPASASGQTNGTAPETNVAEGADPISDEPAQELFAEPAPQAAPAPAVSREPAGEREPEVYQPTGTGKRPQQVPQHSLAIAETLSETQTSNTPYWIAAGGSLVWAAIWVGLSVKGGNIGWSGSFEQFLTNPQWITVLGGAVLPAAVFFMMALLVQCLRRVQTLTNSLAQFAVELGEPEWIAREQIANVGHAVRHELAALHDGLERALARSAELESRVSREVLSLERSYKDNEERMHGVLDKLQGERERLIRDAEQFRASLVQDLTLELPTNIATAGNIIVNNIHDAANRIEHCVAQQGTSLRYSSDAMVDTVTERASAVLLELNRVNNQLEAAFAESARHFTSTMRSSSEDLRAQIDGLGASVLETFENRIARVGQYLADRAEMWLPVPEEDLSTQPADDAADPQAPERDAPYGGNVSSLR